nr:hypothetical protein [Tanacetum cinerariifolium]
VDKDKGGSFGADDEGFIEVKKKRSCGVSPKTAPSIGKKNVSTSGNSSKRGRAKCYPLVEKINMFEKHILEGTCLLVDDDAKPLKKFDYLDDHDSEDEVEPVDNEIANCLALKQLRVGYGTKTLLEQYRETYGNAKYDYDPYDDDLYEGQEFLTIFNL